MAQEYDNMVKYATALRLGTAEIEAILRRFTRNNLQHPTYKALVELGKARRTIFLCRYLRLRELRREIQEGLNIIENWNSANDFILRLMLDSRVVDVRMVYTHHIPCLNP
jgi:TnpA family transposase